MITEFYTGAAWDWVLRVLPQHEPVLITASYLDARVKRVDLHGHPHMIDRGVGKGFSNRTKTPDVTPQRYADLLERQQSFDMAWTYDYPCEPALRKKRGYTVEQAQDMTNENTSWLMERFPDQIHNVVQGWEIEQYAINIDKIRECGLITPRIGIGSICREGDTKRIIKIMKTVKHNLPGWVKLHAFGAKAPAMKIEGKFLVYSWDGMTYPKEWRTGMTLDDKIPKLFSWLEKRHEILNSPDPLYSMEVS